MGRGWDDAGVGTRETVPWRERRPEGWDGTGRMSLNEWWDDLVAPTRGILVARVVLVATGVFLVVDAGWVGLPFGLLVVVLAGAVRLRGQAPRRRPAEPPTPWSPPVAWAAEPGEHAVELLANGSRDGRVNSELIRSLRLLTGGSLRDVRDVYAGAPCVVRRGLSQESAETAVRLLEACRAEARVAAPGG